ncbi:hypothetical protein BDV06DRAFT_217162 [Aspergillus oleicola]
MCFYNQKKFACGDYSWGGFDHQCQHEYRTGETCGMRFVNITELDSSICRLCQKIETKLRRRSNEVDRLTRWKREGSTYVASMEKCQNAIMDLDREIKQLQRERLEKSRTL